MSTCKYCNSETSDALCPSCANQVVDLTRDASAEGMNAEKEDREPYFPRTQALVFIFSSLIWIPLTIGMHFSQPIVPWDQSVLLAIILNLFLLLAFSIAAHILESLYALPEDVSGRSLDLRRVVGARLPVLVQILACVLIYGSGLLYKKLYHHNVSTKLGDLLGFIVIDDGHGRSTLKFKSSLGHHQ